VALLALTAGPARAIESGSVDYVTTHAVAIGIGTPSNAEVRCSGTLIAPNVVLTVRHCFSSTTSETGCAARFDRELVSSADVVVTAGWKADASARWRRASSVVFPNDDAVCGSDLAMVVLATPFAADEAAPARPVTDASGFRRATDARVFGVAGYGASSPTTMDVGIRRSRFDIDIACVPGDGRFACRAALPAYGETELVAGGGACSGDSGAGAIAPREPGTVFAVLARADLDGGRCGAAVYERTDAWAWLIARTVLASSSGVEVPRWVGEVLPAKPTAGQACATEGACVDGSVCAPSSGGRARRCATACTADAACGEGARCVMGACAEAVTAPTTAPPASCAISTRAPTSACAASCIAAFFAALAARRRARARSATARAHAPR
jgi:hypothetical protein